MSLETKNKDSLVAHASALAKGMRQRFPAGAQVLDLGGGVTITVDGACGNLQEIVDNRGAVTTARAEAKAKVAAENGRLPVLRKFVAVLEAFVRFTCGEDATALAAFGLEPHKAPRPLTAEQKAAAALKREATRQARGVIGSRKRKAIKGVVPPPAGPAAPPKA